MIVESTVQQETIEAKQIRAYIEGYIQRYVEMHGHEPHQDDVEDVTQEAIRLYS